MKFILVFFINVIFANVLSEWIDSNNHIINSESYKISFKQEYEANIGGSVHYSYDPGSVIYFNNNIKYESIDKIIIVNQDSLKILNKYSNQIFIEESDEIYSLLIGTNLSEMLLRGQFIDSKEDYYYVDNNGIKIKIYFLNKDIIKVVILYENFIINLSDIKLSMANINELTNYFQIENNLSEIFDLRVK